MLLFSTERDVKPVLALGSVFQPIKSQPDFAAVRVRSTFSPLSKFLVSV